MKSSNYAERKLSKKRYAKEAQKQETTDNKMLNARYGIDSKIGGQF